VSDLSAERQSGRTLNERGLCNRIPPFPHLSLLLFLAAAAAAAVAAVVAILPVAVVDADPVYTAVKARPEKYPMRVAS